VPNIDTPVTTNNWQFNGVVRLTRIGTSFVIFTVVIGFAAINTGNNALYIGLSFMLGCLLLSGIASKGGLKHLVVELDGVDEAWAMRPARGRLRIMNRSRIWNVRDVIVTSAELATPVSIPLIERRGDCTDDAQIAGHDAARFGHGTPSHFGVLGLHDVAVTRKRCRDTQVRG